MKDTHYQRKRGDHKDLQNARSALHNEQSNRHICIVLNRVWESDCVLSPLLFEA